MYVFKEINDFPLSGYEIVLSMAFLNMLTNLF